MNPEKALADLEADLTDDVAALADKWDATATDVEPLEVALEKTDVRVAELVLVWIPMP